MLKEWKPSYGPTRYKLRTPLVNHKPTWHRMSPMLPYPHQGQRTQQPTRRWTQTRLLWQTPTCYRWQFMTQPPTCSPRQFPTAWMPKLMGGNFKQQSLKDKNTSHNFQKNRILTDIILENKKDFDILFIREPPWSFIQNIPSSSSEEGDKVIGAPNHPDWLTFSRPSTNEYKHPWVLIYINVRLTYVRLTYMHFSLWKNIFDHRDMSCFPFFNNGNIFLWSMYTQMIIKQLSSISRILKLIFIMSSLLQP